MAKKMVRGITDVKTITNQDFDTNNVNDLLSDGQYNYIHRKKGENEEYHNLTDNIKTLSSDNTDLLSVTNNNKTTNTATLHPKHDAQKEQLLESTDETIVISHGKNGTEETTSVDVNFEKVQEKLTAGDGLAIENNEIKIKPKNVETLPANSGFYNGAFIIGEWENPYSSISLNIDTNKLIQLAFRESVNTNGLIIGKYRFIVNNVPSSWKEMQLDSEYITSLLARKEQVLESTRNTVTINHGTNGTAEKTTVDTNPQKVLEHENLISDSEFITLNHQPSENTTHIQTAALEQVLQQLVQAISSGGFSRSTIKVFRDTNFKAYKHRVETSEGALTTLSFECYNASETVLTGELKRYLEPYVKPNASISNPSISNGAISITYDGTTMKLINSAGSQNVKQYATFTLPDLEF